MGVPKWGLLIKHFARNCKETHGFRRERHREECRRLDPARRMRTNLREGYRITCVTLPHFPREVLGRGSYTKPTRTQKDGLPYTRT